MLSSIMKDGLIGSQSLKVINMAHKLRGEYFLVWVIYSLNNHILEESVKVLLIQFCFAVGGLFKN